LKARINAICLFTHPTMNILLNRILKGLFP
jgi:hypothetical protein